MKRYSIAIFIMFFVFPVYAISSYKANYDLYAETDFGNINVATAEYELKVFNNTYFFTSNSRTINIWSALYDYSIDEISIGLLKDNVPIADYYKISENDGDLINNYEIQIYPNEIYVSLNNEALVNGFTKTELKGLSKPSLEVNAAEIVDALSIYLHISNDIQKNPNKNLFIYQMVDKKGITQREFTLKGFETISINNKELETIKIVCPEFGLTLNVSKDHNFMPVMIKKINGKTMYKLILRDFMG